MKIRFFNTYEPVSAFYRDLIPYLADNNLDIEIIISNTEYRKRTDLSELFKKYTNVKVTKTPNWGLQAHQGALAKIIVTMLYTLWATIYSLLGSRSDANIYLSQPPLIPLLGYLLKVTRSQPYYCVVMDVQPQVSVALGAFSEHSLVNRLLERVALLSWRHAKAVIVIGRCMREELHQFGIELAQLKYVPNWANEAEIQPVDLADNKLVQDKGWSDKFIVLYAGNIGVPQYFDDLLEVATQTQDKADLIFVFIGGGTRKKMLEEYAAQHNLRNVIFEPFLHNEYSLSEILSAGSCHFISLKDDIAGLAVPSKTYGVLAAGRPIIYQGNASGEIARMIVEEGNGITVPCGQSGALRDAILFHYDNPELATEFGDKARLLSEGQYSRGTALNTYLEIISPESGGHSLDKPLINELVM